MRLRGVRYGKAGCPGVRRQDGGGQHDGDQRRACDAPESCTREDGMCDTGHSVSLNPFCVCAGLLQQGRIHCKTEVIRLHVCV